MQRRTEQLIEALRMLPQLFRQKVVFIETVNGHPAREFSGAAACSRAGFTVAGGGIQLRLTNDAYAQSPVAARGAER